MRQDKLISVVMPVYNRAHLMPRILGSLVQQSYKNLEIIVVDDCSTDDIEGAIAKFNDPRIKLILREKNGGVAAARNSGVAAATGEFIAFHDSDDICVLDRLEKSLERLLALPDDYIGVYGVRFFFDEVTPKDYKHMRTHVRPFLHEAPLEGDLSKRTMSGNIINFPTLLLKAEALHTAGPSDELLKKNVDWDLALRVTTVGKIGFLPEPLIMTPTSLDPEVSGSRVSRSKRQGARSYMRIIKKLRARGIQEEALAKHYASTGMYLMHIDRPTFARKFFGASIACKRNQPRIWAHYFLSHAPQVHKKLRKAPKI